MEKISISDARDHLSELIEKAEAGETIVLTRNGEPVAELVPHRRGKGIRGEGIEEFKKKYGVDKIVSYISDDFDDPLPEDFLIRPLSDP
jgi:prevent-host-death family protein